MQSNEYERPEIREIGRIEEVFLGIPQGCMGDTDSQTFLCW
jgi:hypothetical protein